MRTFFDEKPSYPKPDIKGGWFWLRYPCLAEVKLDGELDYFDGKRLINTYGRVREELPITQELEGVNAVLMGELYYNGGQSFYDEILVNRTSDDLKFCVFDILEHEGKDVTKLPLGERKALLSEILLKSKSATWTHVSMSFGKYMKSPKEVNEYFEATLKEGYEGIVVKNLHSPLVDGLCHNWMKLKKEETLDLAVLGVNKTKKALAVGYPPKDVVGGIGNANKALLRLVEELLEKGKVIDEDREYYFTEPSYVVEVKHSGWIRGKTLRHPVFLRMRPDKRVEEVKRYEKL